MFRRSPKYSCASSIGASIDRISVYFVTSLAASVQPAFRSKIALRERHSELCTVWILHNHWVRWINKAEPVEVDTLSSGPRLYIAGRKERQGKPGSLLYSKPQCHSIPRKKIVFDLSNVIVEIMLIARRSSTPGIFIVCSTHSAEESPLVQVLQTTEVVESILRWSCDIGRRCKRIFPFYFL